MHEYLKHFKTTFYHVHQCLFTPIQLLQETGSVDPLCMTQLSPLSFVAAKRRRLVSNLAMEHLKDQARLDGNSRT